MVLGFPSWSLDKGISPGSSPVEEGPGSLCAVPGDGHFPFQYEGTHSVVRTQAPSGLHTDTFPTLCSLFLCFAILHCRVVLHLHVDKFLNICDFFPKLTKLSSCHESETQFVLFLVICQWFDFFKL